MAEIIVKKITEGKYKVTHMFCSNCRQMLPELKCERCKRPFTGFTYR